MVSRCMRAALVSLALFAAASPARAVFFPQVERPTLKELEQQRAETYWNTLGRRARLAAGEFVGGLALSADYRYNEQDLVGSLAAFPVPFSGDTEINTYSLRPEIVLTNWLSTYAIGGLHNGTSRSEFGTLDLDGWAAGAGVTLALGLPPFTPKWNEDLTFDPLFVIPDFNWTHNEFDDVENTINVYNITTRIGAAVRTDRFSYGLYAGPQYQTSTEDLTVRAGGMLVDLEAEPKDAWSGVIGAVFRMNLTKQKRPELQLSVEGGVGNRQGIQLSLRYEHDFFVFQLFE